MVHIVLDSTANVPPELRQKRTNLHVVPLTVRISTREMAEDELMMLVLEAGADDMKEEDGEHAVACHLYG